MLEEIKRSLFKICDGQLQELSFDFPTGTSNSNLVFESRGTLWFFRYDCIVSSDYPQQALTYSETTSSFLLENFCGSSNQIFKIEQTDLPNHYSLSLECGLN